MSALRLLDELTGFQNFWENSWLVPDINPALNIKQDDDVFEVQVVLPGLKKEEIELQLNSDDLVISGERVIESGDSVKYNLKERWTGKFQRKITLPYRVKKEGLSANLENGILTLKLERLEEDKPRKINIQIEEGKHEK